MLRRSVVRSVYRNGPCVFTNQDVVVADTREQISALNAATRDRRLSAEESAPPDSFVTAAAERLAPGDHVATRRINRDLGVANRDCWTVTGVDDGTLHVGGRVGDRVLPAPYLRAHVELAYPTTVHGTQGETVRTDHLLVGETTGAAAAHVGMTRGRDRNVAYLVADDLDEVRSQWIEVYNRDRADLGPAHARDRALDGIDRYGPVAAGASQSPTAPGRPGPITGLPSDRRLRGTPVTPAT